MTIDQRNRANILLQELGNGVTACWQGKGGINNDQAFELVEKIHGILHENKPEPIVYDNESFPKTWYAL